MAPIRLHELQKKTPSVHAEMAGGFIAYNSFVNVIPVLLSHMATTDKIAEKNFNGHVDLHVAFYTDDFSATS